MWIKGGRSSNPMDNGHSHERLEAELKVSTRWGAMAEGELLWLDLDEDWNL